MNITNPVILFEYDRPVNIKYLTFYLPGVYQYKVSPGIVTIDGGYYENNDGVYNVKSVKANGKDYSRAFNISDCFTADSSFYFDGDSSFLYIHFTDDNPPFAFFDISYGVSVGFCKGNANSVDCEFDGQFYDPRLLEVSSFKREKDPLFYGLLKYNGGSITLDNSDGFFDNWRDLNLFSQAARVLIGDVSWPYSSFKEVYTGYIEDDTRSFESITVEIQDVRKSFTQLIANRRFTTGEFEYLAESNIDLNIPVAYGQIWGGKAFCIDQNISASRHTFVFCDTQFNPADALLAVYVDGVAKRVYNIDLVNGTFDLSTSDIADNYDAVTCDFIGTDFTNGVEIIKDLIANYEQKPLVSSWWDLTEYNTALGLSRNTSLYIADDTTLAEAIQRVCFDIDGLFFTKRNGLFTVRIYDETKEPIAKIYKNQWQSPVSISDNASEYLSSAVVKYRKDQTTGEFYTYIDKTKEFDAFAIYKRFKTDEFETGLMFKTAAEEKAATIMKFSSNVKDIIKRSIFMDFDIDLEIMDFIDAAPKLRFAEEECDNCFSVYEILGITENVENLTTELKLRDVRRSDVYFIITDEDGNYLVDESNNILIGEE